MYYVDVTIYDRQNNKYTHEHKAIEEIAVAFGFRNWLYKNDLKYEVIKNNRTINYQWFDMNDRTAYVIFTDGTTMKYSVV